MIVYLFLLQIISAIMGDLATQNNPCGDRERTEGGTLLLGIQALTAGVVQPGEGMALGRL